MQEVIRTHNSYHLGDNMVHLNFLRRVALANPERKFIHAARWQYTSQLKDVVFYVSNIELVALENDTYYAWFDTDSPRHKESINAWRGAGGDWYRHWNRNNFVAYHCNHWFPKLAGLMGVDNPVKRPEDMLFDYPAIKHAKIPDLLNYPLDVLVINSPPGSGQWNSYNEVELGILAKSIARSGKRIVSTAKVPGSMSDSSFVPCTQDYWLSVTQIGYLSLLCHTIVMVSTGPSWPTFNVWNQDTVKRRIILLDEERVELSPNTFHCRTVEQATEILRRDGII